MKRSDGSIHDCLVRRYMHHCLVMENLLGAGTPALGLLSVSLSG